MGETYLGTVEFTEDQPGSWLRLCTCVKLMFDFSWPRLGLCWGFRVLANGSSRSSSYVGRYRTLMKPRLAHIMATPGSIALAVTTFSTDAEAEAETPTARAPLNIAFDVDGTPCEWPRRTSTACRKGDKT